MVVDILVPCATSLQIFIAIFCEKKDITIAAKNNDASQEKGKNIQKNKNISTKHVRGHTQTMWTGQGGGGFPNCPC